MELDPQDLPEQKVLKVTLVQLVDLALLVQQVCQEQLDQRELKVPLA